MEYALQNTEIVNSFNELYRELANMTKQIHALPQDYQKGLCQLLFTNFITPQGGNKPTKAIAITWDTQHDRPFVKALPDSIEIPELWKDEKIGDLYSVVHNYLTSLTGCRPCSFIII